MGNWERTATFAMFCGLCAVVVVTFGVIVATLSDANVTALGHWVDAHGSAIWKTLAAAASAVATFFLGNLRGRRIATAETELADAAAAKGLSSGDAAAEVILEKRARRVSGA